MRSVGEPSLELSWNQSRWEGVGQRGQNTWVPDWLGGPNILIKRLVMGATGGLTRGLIVRNVQSGFVQDSALRTFQGQNWKFSRTFPDGWMRAREVCQSVLQKKSTGIHVSNITMHFQNKLPVVCIAISEHIVIFTWQQRLVMLEHYRN